MEHINRSIANVSVSFPPHKNRLGEEVDVTRKYLRRIFLRHDNAGDNEFPDAAPRLGTVRHPVRGTKTNFHSHGRLYGGFWQELPREDRKYLLIDGEPIAQCDFKNFMPRVASHLVGRPIEPGVDPYAIAGLPRDQIKKIMSAMFFLGPDMQRYPKGTGSLAEEMSFADLKTEIFKSIPKEAFGLKHPTGHSILHVESEIIVLAVRGAFHLGLPVLPLHDCLLCRKKDAQAVASTMREAVSLVGVTTTFRLLGLELPIQIG